MRLVSYVLSILAVFLLVNIFLSYYSDSYHIALQNIKTKIVGNENTVKIEKQNDLNEKFLNSLEKLNDNIDKIASTKDKPNTNSGNTSSGNELKPNEEILGLPDLLITKLMPDISTSKIANGGIFGLNKEKSLEKIRYSTYYNKENKLKIYVIDTGYNEIISKFIGLDSMFKVYEANNFFGYTFYLNKLKKDNKTRFIILLEGVTVGFEIDTNKYDLLKKLLLK